VVSRTGKELAVTTDSVLLHGDGPDAVAVARRVKQALLDAGVTIAPLAGANALTSR
jgi:UPF0271 protein